MAEPSSKKRVWGWYFFDWATQPYHTLLLTFIFGPFFVTLAAEQFASGGTETEAAKAQAQSVWSTCLAVVGLTVGLSAPIMGALADASGKRMRWIILFSAIYFVGAAALWGVMPDGS